MSKDWTQEIEDLYRSSVKEVYSYCVRRLACRSLADEATSSVFLRLVREYPSLRAKGPQGIRSWLYGTASNVAASMLLDARHQQQITEELTRQRLESAGDDDERGSRLDWPVLYKAIAKLKPRQQDLVVLRFFHGLETADIAEALGMNHATVRVEISRAVQSLKRTLEGAFGELPEPSR